MYFQEASWPFKMNIHPPAWQLSSFSRYCSSITYAEGEFSTWPGKACLLDITHVCTWVSSSENEEGFTSHTVELGVATHHRILPMKCERGDTSLPCGDVYELVHDSPCSFFLPDHKACGILPKMMPENLQ